MAPGLLLASRPGLLFESGQGSCLVKAAPQRESPHHHHATPKITTILVTWEGALCSLRGASASVPQSGAEASRRLGLSSPVPRASARRLHSTAKPIQRRSNDESTKERIRAGGRGRQPTAHGGLHGWDRSCPPVVRTPSGRRHRMAPRQWGQAEGCGGGRSQGERRPQTCRSSRATRHLRQRLRCRPGLPFRWQLAPRRPHLHVIGDGACTAARIFGRPPIGK